MTRSRILAGLCALALAAPAFAQATYPTPAGSRVNGVVPLQCDASGANCAPLSSTNPTLTSDGSTAPAQGNADAQPTSILGDTNNDRLYIFNGTTWDRSRAAPNADGQASTGILSSGTELFNGTTWDRARGDTIGGQWVQEKERTSYFTDTTTPLGSSATFAGPSHDAGVSPSQWRSFSCFFLADQNATNAQIQESPDGTTYTSVIVQAYTASTSLILNAPLFQRYARCAMINGATAQGSLKIWSQFGAN